MSNRAVTVIPPTISTLARMPLAPTAKRRVAGYARVSTDSKEQMTSYKTQVDYYTRYIQEQPDWEFAGVYTDEGISAVNTKKRDGFNQMVRDALNGKIDLIVTKSVSRFARNTVDSLVTVRKLKEKGVEVYFEKENIYTLDSKGELLITIMSSLAQEESRSISENVTWGQRKRFADGKVSVAYKQFLGYEKGEDDIPRIVEKEAVIVQRIYALFMAGKTPGGIARLLTAEGIPTPAGKEQWRSSTIESILTNEKYKGAALLQKKFTVDFLLKKMKPNEGEVAIKALSSPEYRLSDCIHWIDGSSRGSGPMWESYIEWNAFEMYTKIEVPVYFFAGENDFNTPLDLVRQYCEMINAPAGKKLIVFKDSSHTPFFKQPDEFYRQVVKVKNEASNRN